MKGKYKTIPLVAIMCLVLSGCGDQSIVNPHDYSHKEPMQIENTDWMVDYIMDGNDIFQEETGGSEEVDD